MLAAVAVLPSGPPEATDVSRSRRFRLALQHLPNPAQGGIAAAAATIDARVPGSAFALFCSRRRAEVKTLLERKRATQKQWVKEFEALKQQHRQQQHHEDQQAPQSAAATTPSIITEFPQARIIKIARLTPSVKKLSAEGARYLNLATAAALRQFTMRSLSGRDSDKALILDDVQCKYVVTEEQEVEELGKDADCCPSMQIDEIGE
ncbi:hypothetical protein Emag_005837 [Eimeria magna]